MQNWKPRRKTFKKRSAGFSLSEKIRKIFFKNYIGGKKKIRFLLLFLWIIKICRRRQVKSKNFSNSYSLQKILRTLKNSIVGKHVAEIFLNVIFLVVSRFCETTEFFRFFRISKTRKFMKIFLSRNYVFLSVKDMFNNVRVRKVYQ